MAIATPLDFDRRELMRYHCTGAWEGGGLSQYENVLTAKKKDVCPQSLRLEPQLAAFIQRAQATDIGKEKDK